jgi:hypothetical protein
MTLRYLVQSSLAWWHVIDTQPGESLDPYPVASISTRVSNAEKKIRELAETLNDPYPRAWPPAGWVKRKPRLDLELVRTILSQMIAVKPWGTFYDPPKAFTVRLNTSGSDIQLVSYQVHDWPKNAQFAKDAAESFRRIVIDQFTERFLAIAGQTSPAPDTRDAEIVELKRENRALRINALL